jgi:hypothetical protein
VQPEGYVSNADDCDDSDAGITLGELWHADSDNDSYGNPSDTLRACTQPPDYVSNASDCDDSDAGITTELLWFGDSDNDSYGNPADTLRSCTQPVGYVLNADDCDDSDGLTYPGAPAVADGKDNNCDGTIDKVDQTITFETIHDQPDTITYITLTASVTSGLEVEFIVIKGNVFILKNIAAVNGPGEVEIQAIQNGNDHYNPAEPVNRTFCITPSKPVVSESFDNQDIILISSYDTGNIWHLDNLPMNIEGSKTIYPQTSGSYTVQVIIGGCLSEISDPVHVEITGINDIINGEITIYPNPTRDWLIFKLPDDLKDSRLNISIIDMSGRIVLRSDQMDVFQDERAVYLGPFPAGQYYYIIEDISGGRIYRGRFIYHK